ncbi:MAG: hypothetical protein Q7J07_10405 [Pelolinea sp.]|nr:hypothetical protein [Pelolinea sp.]
MRKVIAYQLLIVCVSLIAAGCTPRAPQPDLPEPRVEPTETAAPVEILSTEAVPEGWNSYTDEALGLSFSYPDPYAVLTDAENLHGWDNCVLLLYDSGQSYDIAVQVWETVEEMESYFGARMVDVTVFEKPDQFISVFNITMEESNSAIIATFEVDG